VPSGCYFADLFSGEGGISAKLATAGFPARQWDTRLGTRGDLTKRSVLRQLLRDIREGRCLGGVLGTPCTSFSLARDRAGLIRTKDSPWGLPNLSEKDQAKVDEGNATLRASLKIIMAFQDLELPWILENPNSSRLWHCDGVKAVAALDSSEKVVTDYCQFGKPWRKRTRFLCGNIDTAELGRLRQKCMGRGRCSRTGKPHMHLEGRCPKTNVHYTKLAEPYPAKLCHAIVHALTAQTMDSLIQKMAN
jgi:hypothetical protein